MGQLVLTDHVIFPSVPDTATLHAAPSTAHEEPILVRNAGPAPIEHVYVSHRERYIAHDRHVELVRSVRPAAIAKIGTNETVTVAVNFQIPHYVKNGAQVR